jgi:hypothetical protein
VLGTSSAADVFTLRPTLANRHFIDHCRPVLPVHLQLETICQQLLEHDSELPGNQQLISEGASPVA